MKKFGICGYGGRMGQTIHSIMEERGYALGCAFDMETSPIFGTEVYPEVKVSAINVELLKNADVVIDFSSPAATVKLLDACIASGTAIVIGTTGIDGDLKKKITAAAEKIPVFFTPNMSVGVSLMFKLVEMASVSIPDGYDVEIFEAHHKFKKDAPSGTALKLLEIVKENCARLSDAAEIFGRQGITGERTHNEIGMQVMRGGDIVGEHTVFYTGIGERLEITHRATDRRTFAEGAVTAAAFLTGKKPGLYNMSHALGF
ncbi:MAG: 4-hydroxy-tetrahydrodipicolinate reductase [Spirochaetes bacterium]|nr:4-hydroxy-tetrahydrodipicolinate reductase [Spirochaetota bacterium]